MPIIGIVVSYVGASLGTAAFAGTALASVGSAIGAGIAGGLYSSSQGGDFGKGFLMGAAGNFIGNQLGDVFGGGAGGLSEEAFQAADAASLMGTTDAFGNTLSAGAIGQNMGASAGNWSSMMGDIGTNLASSSGLGDMDIAGYGDTSQIMPASGETWIRPEDDLLMDIEVTADRIKPNGVETFPYNPETPPPGMPMYDVGTLNPIQVSPGEALTFDDYSYVQKPYTVEGYDANAFDYENTNNLGEIKPATTTPTLENITSGTPAQSASITDNLGKWFKDTDTKLGTMGFPKGSTAMGMIGLGSYLQSNYETYKMEQMAKGLKPMTLEEYKNKMYNPNDYKVAANTMAQSGRTGTLPTLLARMNQNAGSTYANNYLPTAQNNWWNAQTNVANAKTANLSNLVKPLAGAWAMNQGKK